MPRHTSAVRSPGIAHLTRQPPEDLGVAPSGFAPRLSGASLVARNAPPLDVQKLREVLLSQPGFAAQRAPVRRRWKRNQAFAASLPEVLEEIGFVGHGPRMERRWVPRPRLRGIAKEVPTVTVDTSERWRYGAGAMGPKDSFNSFRGGWIRRYEVAGWQVEAYVEVRGEGFAVRAVAFYPPQGGSDWVLEEGLQLARQEEVPKGAPTLSWVLRNNGLAEQLVGLKRAHKDMHKKGRVSLFPPRQRHRGVGIPPGELADIAERYLDALRLDPRRPLLAMLARYRAEGFKTQERDRIRDLVELAREHGFLTRPRKAGVAGGEAGPALIEWRQRQEGGEG